MLKMKKFKNMIWIFGIIKKSAEKMRIICCTECIAVYSETNRRDGVSVHVLRNWEKLKNRTMKKLTKLSLENLIS